jgi:hypothetical protein
MRRWLALGRSGAVAVLLHPLRSAVTVASLVAVLLPYVAGLAIARGLLDQARDAIRLGPDLLVEGERLGRPAPVPLEAVGEVRAIPGVRESSPIVASPRSVSVSLRRPSARAPRAPGSSAGCPQPGSTNSSAPPSPPARARVGRRSAASPASACRRSWACSAPTCRSGRAA